MSEDGGWYYYWEDEWATYMKSPRVAGDDKIRGQCSALPECCIKFYIGTWAENPGVFIDHEINMRDARAQGSNFQYVPCPECLAAKRFVKIRSCDGPSCFCGQWERRHKMKLNKLDVMSPEARRAYRNFRYKVRAKRKLRRGWA